MESYVISGAWGYGLKVMDEIDTMHNCIGHSASN